MTRWQYHKSDGSELWLAFDPTRSCVYCDMPVGELSYGGPAVCSACDCGHHRDGRKWTQHEAIGLIKKARAKIDAMPLED